MDRDEYADMFRFRIGDCVRWAEYPGERYYVGQRRWTERQILDPVVEYRLTFRKTGLHTAWMSWVLQSDLEAWPEEPIP